MQFLPIIYLVYMFVSFYLLILFLLVYFKNKNSLFEIPLKTKDYSLSILVPAYNEEAHIAGTIRAIFNADYPKEKLEVIAINDGSTDNTLGILKELLKEYKGRIRILNKKNSGKADSLNKAIKFARGELVAVVDADSYPSKESFMRLIGFFDDPKTGVATATCVPRNRNKFIEKMQVIEYKVIAFTRKLLGYIDSIYVAPGSLSIYRKKALEDIGGFDTTNVTEDIEVTIHLIHNGWKVKMCFNSVVYTTVPHEIKQWFKQRRRWAVGGIQSLNKYKKCFLDKGILGSFIVPFFALGYFLGITGFFILAYLSLKRVLKSYLFTRYSLSIGVPILSMDDLYITPTVLNYFGLILFLLFLLFNLFVLAIMKDKIMEKQSFFNMLFYMTIYLLIYPVILLVSCIDFARGKIEWGTK